MSYPELTRFDFHHKGRSNRRDADARPSILFVGMEANGDRLRFHAAGDEYVRSAHVFDAAFDDELVAGMEPQDAFRLGIAYEQARAKALGAV